MRESDEKLAAIAQPVLRRHGCELLLLEWKSHSGRRVLRFTIDASDGVNLDLCERVSRELGDLLDLEDDLGEGYVLEVSSPGINRPLVRLDDFRRFVGEIARIQLHAPLQGGRRRAKGLIRRVTQEDHIIVDTEEGAVLDLSFDNIAKANLVRI